LGLKFVVALYVIGGVLELLAAVALVLIGSLAAKLLANASLAALGAIAGVIMSAVIALLILAGIISLVVAWGLWNLKPWARIVAAIFAILGLFSFPWGTLLNAIVLYVLFFDESTKALFV